jgi:quercetin dioxygenase-like cupin family protein
MKYLIRVLPYFLLVVHSVHAQEIVPACEEPRHHLVYDSDILRVLDVQIPSGDTTLYHTHDAAFFNIMISASAIDDQVPGGEWKEIITASDIPSIKTGDVSCTLEYADYPVTHRVRNAGNRLFHLIGIVNKRKRPVNGASQDKHELPGNSEIENRYFRQSRAAVAPGESIDLQDSNAPVVIVQVCEGKTQVSINKDSPRMLRAPGDFAVAGPGQPFEIVNRGSSPAEYVLVGVN